MVAESIYFIHASNGDFGFAIEVLDENIILISFCRGIPFWQER